MPVAAKTTADVIGELLTAFLKSGPQTPDDGANVESRVLEIAYANVPSPEQSTEDYKKRCDDFLATVIKAGGMPIRKIGSAKVAGTSDGLIATRRREAKQPIPLAKLRANHKFCVENYGREARLYLDGEMNAFRALLGNFIREVPVGGTTDKATRRKIVAIKAAFRDLTKWTRLFSTIKAYSFPASLQRTFDPQSGQIAAIWHYSVMDEQGEFRNAYIPIIVAKERLANFHSRKVQAMTFCWALKSRIETIAFVCKKAFRDRRLK